MNGRLDKAEFGPSAEWLIGLTGYLINPWPADRTPVAC